MLTPYRDAEQRIASPYAIDSLKLRATVKRQTQQSNRFRSVIIALVAIGLFAAVLRDPLLSFITQVPPSPRIDLNLNGQWQVQSSARVSDDGARFSRSSYHDGEWMSSSLPTSIMGAMIANHAFAYDPLYGTNLQAVDEGQFTSARWWFRRAFDLPATATDRRVWLKLEGLNYRAQVWVNGVQLRDPMPQNASTADQIQFTGTFRTYMVDITSVAHRGGSNALAIGLTRAAGAYQAFSVHYVDWNPDPPDMDMGILNGVSVAITGPVRLAHPYVVTNSLANNAAAVTIYVDAVNGSGSATSGTLTGTLAGIPFTQTVKVGAHATQTLAIPLTLQNPRLWWPWQYGSPDLTPLALHFTLGDDEPSDDLATQVGIRTVTSRLISVPGYDPQRIFTVNGKDILIRGAAYNPDIFYNEDPAREEATMQYIRQMNLNAIRFEGVFMDDNFYNLADKYGILTTSGWQCCSAYQEEDNVLGGADIEVVKEELRSLLYRLREHPSTLFWMNGSDHAPQPQTLATYYAIENDLHWTPAIPAVSSATDRMGNNPPTRDPVNAPSGMKMRGPYQYVPPSYWENDALSGAAWGFATEISPGPDVPVSEGLNQFLAPNSLLDSTWNYHTPNGSYYHNLDILQGVLRDEYGGWSNRDTFAALAQAEGYEAHRAMFEAWGRKKYHNATGVIQWMLNDAWPGMYWNLYDYYMHPGGGFFGTQTALEPLHIQYTYLDRTVSLVNSTRNAFPGMTARAQVYNINGKQAWDSGTVTTSIAADGERDLLRVPAGNYSTTYFLRLTLSVNGKVVSQPTYWLSTASPTGDNPDYTALQRLPQPSLKTTDTPMSDGTRVTHTITVTNTGASVAFFVRVALNKGPNGGEIAPILWSDNYLTLLPGESRTITASYRPADLGTAPAQLVIHPFP